MERLPKHTLPIALTTISFVAFLILSQRNQNRQDAYKLADELNSPQRSAPAENQNGKTETASIRDGEEQRSRSLTSTPRKRSSVAASNDSSYPIESVSENVFTTGRYRSELTQFGNLIAQEKGDRHSSTVDHSVAGKTGSMKPNATGRIPASPRIAGGDDVLRKEEGPQRRQKIDPLDTNGEPQTVHTESTNTTPSDAKSILASTNTPPQTSQNPNRIETNGNPGAEEQNTPSIQPPMPLVSNTNQDAQRKPLEEEINWFPAISLPPATVTTYYQKVRYAESLARRGAISTAETELKNAIYLICEVLDQGTRSRRHTDAWNQAFKAIQESKDFSQNSGRLDLIVAGHQTQILNSKDLDKASFNQARLAYFQHAEATLLKACGGQSVCGEAFRSLGKVYSISEKFEEDAGVASAAKAMVMLRLATMINPNDANSSNELGVMYARFNYLNEAKQLFQQSLRARPTAETWRNLAKVHNKLGEQQFAQMAENESQMLERSVAQTKRVQWTSPEQFNQVQSMVDPPVMTNQSQRTANAQSRNQNSNQGFFQKR